MIYIVRCSSKAVVARALVATCKFGDMLHHIDSSADKKETQMPEFQLSFDYCPVCFPKACFGRIPLTVRTTAIFLN